VSDSPIIHASELGEFSYCHRAWWLRRVKGLPSTNVAALASGRALHAEHGRAARRVAGLERLALVSLVAAALLVGAGLIVLLAFKGGGL